MDEHANGPPCDPRLPGGHRMSIVAPTLGDAAESCVNGPSGLKAHNPDVKMTGRTGGTIVSWPNGAEAKLFGGWTAGDVERFRAGGNRCYCWIEEAAAIPQLDAVYEQIPFGHRLGPNPRVFLSTTPKPRALLKKLKAASDAWRNGIEPSSRWARVVMSQGSSRMNRSIDDDVVQGLYDLFGGTRIGRQELEGELLDDYEGALWQREQIDADRISAADLPTLVRRYVGVDPSTWGTKLGDRRPEEGEVARGIETGIIVSGVDARKHTYTLADYSRRCSPAEWADRALDAYWKYNAHGIVFETNAGGAMGPSIIRAQEKLRRLERPDDAGPPVRFYSEKSGRIGVQASDGKRARAEPVAVLAEQHTHHMVESQALLEDQLCTWDPDEPWSPDRLDAFVWSIFACKPWKRAGTNPFGNVHAGGAVAR
jgi:phage terminase large subunit-like protein